jgi:hypothetical protein
MVAYVNEINKTDKSTERIDARFVHDAALLVRLMTQFGGPNPPG